MKYGILVIGSGENAMSIDEPAHAQTMKCFFLGGDTLMHYIGVKIVNIFRNASIVGFFEHFKVIYRIA